MNNTLLQFDATRIRIAADCVATDAMTLNAVKGDIVGFGLPLFSPIPIV